MCFGLVLHKVPSGKDLRSPIDFSPREVRDGAWVNSSFLPEAGSGSTPEAALDGEAGGLEVGERSAQLVYFGGRAVEFEAGEVGHGEELAEQSAHVFQMCQDRAGPGVTFPAEDLVLQGGEFIKTAGGFGAGFFDKSGQQGLDLRQPPGMRFKIRMQGDEIGRNGHDRIMVKGGWIYGEKAVLIPSRR